MVSVGLSDPLYPAETNEESLEKRAQLSQRLANTVTMPSVTDAIQDFNAQIDAITREISVEYTRMFNGEETSDTKLGSPRSKPHHAQTSTSY